MSHTRPHGLGWAEGQRAEPVEIQADPPGDGIGPDHTAPDLVQGLDAKEARRLQRDHRELTKASEGDRPSTAADEPNDTQHGDAPAPPFDWAKVGQPDPREGKADR